MKSKDWRPTAFIETAPGVVSEEEADASRADRRRALYELLRHLMTLDSVALVLTVTLIEKVFVQPVHRAAVAVAVGAFMLSLIVGGFAYFNLLAAHPRVGSAHPSSADQRTLVGTTAATLLAFVSGMGALAWFFCKNWLR